MTLADVYLCSQLVESFKQLLDKKTRLQKFKNLTRYITLIMGGFHFENNYGPLVLCKKSANPPTAAEIAKAAPKEEAKISSK